jgi:hypothetical protein
VTAASVVAIQVLVNYQGPARPIQTWTWQIFDWVHNGFVTVGDNFFAPQSKPWTVLNFNIGGNNIADYVRGADNQIRLQTLSSNAAGDADIDYEALVVTSTSNPAPAGRTFFVSTAGRDTNPGTISAPFRTISKAATVAIPGSTVYVRGGVYHERVVAGVSGTASGGFIQFQSFPGENAIIDGTGVVMPPVISTPTGLIQITDRNYLIFQGFEIRNFTSNTPNLFPAGVSITGACDHVEIRHNLIHSINNGINGAHGLGVYGTEAPGSISNLVVDGNEIFDLVLGQSESTAFNGNVQFFSVTNNIIHDNNNIGIDAIGFEGTSPNPD